MSPGTATTKRRKSPFRWIRRVLSLVGVVLLALAALLGMLASRHERIQFDTDAARGIEYTPLRSIVPGAGAAGAEIMQSNNNVDVIRFREDYYMAFRTAPTHFASSKTKLVVVRSADRQNWELETEFGLDASDLREPRFLVFKDTLFFYFFQAGDKLFSFSPRSIHVMQRKPEGGWTPPQAIFQPGYVDWRVKARGDIAYMSVYHGAGLYTTQERAGEIRLLTSNDGVNWTPISEKPQCTEPGAEEAEFEFDAEGNLVATVRLEVKGALVCTASKDDLATWEYRFTPEKYDSALMFRRGPDFYVIARRNVAGPFNRGLDFLPERLQRAWYLARYSLTRKRTALYKVNAEEKRLAPLFDFPSKGDTAFAGIAPIDARSYYVVNYSSPIEGFDWPWLGGQFFGSRLYETVLTFPETQIKESP